MVIFFYFNHLTEVPDEMGDREERRSKRTALKESDNDAIEENEQGTQMDILESNLHPLSKKAKTLEKKQDDRETSTQPSGKS